MPDYDLPILCASSQTLPTSSATRIDGGLLPCTGSGIRNLCPSGHTSYPQDMPPSIMNSNCGFPKVTLLAGTTYRCSHYRISLHVKQFLPVAPPAWLTAAFLRDLFSARSLIQRAHIYFRSPGLCRSKCKKVAVGGDARVLLRVREVRLACIRLGAGCEEDKVQIGLPGWPIQAGYQHPIGLVPLGRNYVLGGCNQVDLGAPIGGFAPDCPQLRIDRTIRHAVTRGRPDRGVKESGVTRFPSRKGDRCFDRPIQFCNPYVTGDSLSSQQPTRVVSGDNTGDQESVQAPQSRRPSDRSDRVPSTGASGHSGPDKRECHCWKHRIRNCCLRPGRTPPLSRF